MPFALRTAPPEISARNSAGAPCTHQFLDTLTVQTTKIKPTPTPTTTSAGSTTAQHPVVVIPRDGQHRVDVVVAGAKPATGELAVINDGHVPPPVTITVSPSPHDYGSDHPPNAAPPSPPPAPPVLARPALISGPDNSASHQSSDYGWDLTRSGNNVTGWATLAGRGTPETSCYFAGNVLTSYWNQCGLAIKLRGRNPACRLVAHLSSGGAPVSLSKPGYTDSVKV